MVDFFNKSFLKRLRDRLGIGSLTTREGWVLSCGLVFTICFLIFQFVAVPFIEARNNLSLSIEQKKKELVKVRELQQEYRNLKKAEGDVQAKIAAREPGFALFTFIDRQAEKAKVKKQISYIKPSTGAAEQSFHETSIEMKLQQITLESLVNFLLLVESEKDVVFIRRISIQENGNGQGYLDSILQIVTFEKKV
ncbi:MAG: type II secretion system protein M [Proteobacteria bacterium]|nr:type II secretion system protein M [Pseudomonadota bacterium]